MEKGDLKTLGEKFRDDKALVETQLQFWKVEEATFAYQSSTRLKMRLDEATEGIVIDVVRDIREKWVKDGKLKCKSVRSRHS
jgi:hypothetical protein